MEKNEEIEETEIIFSTLSDDQVRNSLREYFEQEELLGVDCHVLGLSPSLDSAFEFIKDQAKDQGISEYEVILSCVNFVRKLHEAGKIWSEEDHDLDCDMYRLHHLIDRLVFI